MGPEPTVPRPAPAGPDPHRPCAYGRPAGKRSARFFLTSTAPFSSAPRATSPLPASESPQGAALAQLLARFRIQEAPEAVLARFFRRHRGGSPPGPGCRCGPAGGDHRAHLAVRPGLGVAQQGARFRAGLRAARQPGRPHARVEHNPGSPQGGPPETGADLQRPVLHPAALQLVSGRRQRRPRLRSAAGLLLLPLGVAKPSPRLFQAAAAACERQGLPPAAVLYVGNDICNDIRPARQAGFQTALFAGDRRSLRLREDNPACRRVRPDLVITELPQLIDRCLTGRTDRPAG